MPMQKVYARIITNKSRKCRNSKLFLIYIYCKTPQRIGEFNFFSYITYTYTYN